MRAMSHPRLRLLPTLVRPGDLEERFVPDGNIDGYGRTIDYLRIGITDRCNLRCVYCMPADGVPLEPQESLLTFDETVRVAAAARRVGFRKFRITGGEPLVVRGAMTLIGQIRAATEGALLCLTTNGVRLAEAATDLHRLGVQRLNISLDTLDPQQFRTLTRRDNLRDVLEGLDRALEVGFERIKLNAVIVPGRNEDALVPLVTLARDRAIDIRFIEQMPLDGQADGGYLGAAEIVDRISEVYPLEPEAPEDHRQAAQLMFRSSELAGKVGVIAPRSAKFCSSCNRMRLTPSGELKGCLLSEGTLDLRPVLREGISDEDLDRLMRYAIGIKPKEYLDHRYGLDRSMSAIGG